MEDPLPRTGDTVKHLPTGETWIVAGVEGDDLYACGWPCTFAKITDCDLVGRCTDEEHEALLRDIAKMDEGELPDPRAALARRVLAERARVFMPIEHAPEYLERVIEEGVHEVARLDRRILDLREARRMYAERKDSFHGASLNIGPVSLHLVSTSALREMDAYAQALEREQQIVKSRVENDAHELANVRARIASNPLPQHRPTPGARLRNLTTSPASALEKWVREHDGPTRYRHDDGTTSCKLHPRDLGGCYPTLTSAEVRWVIDQEAKRAAAGQVRPG